MISTPMLYAYFHTITAVTALQTMSNFLQIHAFRADFFNLQYFVSTLSPSNPVARKHSDGIL